MNLLIIELILIIYNLKKNNCYTNITNLNWKIVKNKNSYEKKFSFKSFHFKKFINNYSHFLLFYAFKKKLALL